MKKAIFLLLGILLLFTSCGAKEETASAENRQEAALEQPAEPEPEPVLSEEELKQVFLEDYISAMPLEEQVGQLFMVAYRRDEGNQPVLGVNDSIRQDLEQYYFGGIILFGENIDTEEQTAAYIKELQSISKTPLFIGIDEEGGRVSRLHASGKIDMPEIPSAARMGQDQDLGAVYDNYTCIGQKLKKLGFLVDFAPVADMNTNPKNTVIGDRAFGSEPELVGDMVAAAVRGLQDSGVSAAVKHFPGHGDTFEDSHKGEAVVSHTMERLVNTEILPFQQGIDAGVDFVMVSHIKTPNATGNDLPASLSKVLLTDLLRNQMGFEGIIITDAFDMGAITQYYNSSEAALTAFQAGVDILLMPQDPGKVYQAVLDAVQQGDFPKEQLEESLHRVLSVKYDLGMLDS